MAGVRLFALFCTQRRPGMDVRVGDHILTKKPHPCGASEFVVLRVGMDFRIRCVKCGREVMVARSKIEKKTLKKLCVRLCRFSRAFASVRAEGSLHGDFSDKSGRKLCTTMENPALYAHDMKNWASFLQQPDVAADPAQYARLMKEYKT